ncbi:hypothetical protein XI06_35205 [Bradyrhizobium sp. CCBAU 11434]|uniref:hypothetical protein n=1 Tax=Bradyrhizobium sp. CCBAU 11434 TaxID=1630885 RepID=UPI002306CA15|nr:hypothetical protein [Bradyrhizobium sp. CCBAU 11434]MDA9525422.1 hypothetical protein [Bradyrhizobium sp. CCBAU 11434]
MQFESAFKNADFSALKPGALFFHPLAGGHSPALKVITAQGNTMVVDLNLEQQNNTRAPTLMAADDFHGTSVVFVPEAIIRPTGGLSNLTNGSGGTSTIDRGALILLPSSSLLKVKGPQMQTFVFDVDSGQQSTNPDSAKCIWSDKWEVVIRQGDREEIIFTRKP